METLVALAVVAMSLAAIGRLANATSRSGVYVERHLAEVETAQQILASLQSREQMRDGVSGGNIAGHDWRVAETPFRADFVAPGAAAPWIPERLALVVRAPGAAPFTIEMIRLVRPRAR